MSGFKKVEGSGGTFLKRSLLLNQPRLSQSTIDFIYHEYLVTANANMVAAALSEMSVISDQCIKNSIGLSASLMVIFEMLSLRVGALLPSVIGIEKIFGHTADHQAQNLAWIIIHAHDRLLSECAKIFDQRRCAWGAAA